MARSKTRIIALGTALVALGTGYVMQYGLGLPSQSGSTLKAAKLEVTAIKDTSSASDAVIPQAPGTDITLSQTPVKVATTAEATPANPAPLPTEAEAPAFTCDISFDASLAPAAQVDLSLFAPCLRNERVTLHHNGLMLTETTDEEGRLNLTVPALAERAVFIASFSNGEGGVSQVDVPTLANYSRVALQWQGRTGLELHAREFGADYYTDGHIWTNAVGSIDAAISGEGGFLVKLGDSSAPEALVAEVYTFPSVATTRTGEIDLSVETAITDVNCGREVEAQTLQLTDDGALNVRDLTLTVPDCDATGDFLVLEDLVNDVSLARTSSK